MSSTINGHVEIVRLLLDKGAAVDALNNVSNRECGDDATFCNAVGVDEICVLLCSVMLSYVYALEPRPTIMQRILPSRLS